VEEHSLVLLGGLPLSVLDGYLTARPSLSERRDS